MNIAEKIVTIFYDRHTFSHDHELERGTWCWPFGIEVSLTATLSGGFLVNMVTAKSHKALILGVKSSVVLGVLDRAAFSAGRWS